MNELFRSKMLGIIFTQYVILACPESFLRKDSRQAGMTTELGISYLGL
jgi:hypothetical protein